MGGYCPELCSGSANPLKYKEFARHISLCYEKQIEKNYRIKSNTPSKTITVSAKIQKNERRYVMKLKRGFSRGIAAVLAAVLAGIFCTAEYYSVRLPDAVTVDAGTELRIANYPDIGCIDSPEGDSATLALFGTVPVKSVAVKQEETPVLCAGGMPFGIKLLMEGVMVTGLGEVTDNHGSRICPADASGIQKGDIIKLADGKKVSSNGELQQIISSSGGKAVRLIINRNGTDSNIDLMPVYSSEGVWRGGMWVRDSIAGIGTVSFFDPATGRFAGLGHPVCDSDTGENVPLHSGEAVSVDITEAQKGEKGIPGELKGSFDNGVTIGILEKNTSSGVFGTLTAKGDFSGDNRSYPMGRRQDVKTGKAYILSTIQGGEPKKYSAEIERVDYKADDTGRNMVIHITDPLLLDTAGGIVQGMSGSPIIQDNKLIGAVTHVFVADPTRGYGIFAETMYDTMNGA